MTNNSTGTTLSSSSATERVTEANPPAHPPPSFSFCLSGLRLAYFSALTPDQARNTSSVSSSAKHNPANKSLEADVLFCHAANIHVSDPVLL